MPGVAGYLGIFPQSCVISPGSGVQGAGCGVWGFWGAGSTKLGADKLLEGWGWGWGVLSPQNKDLSCGQPSQTLSTRLGGVGVGGNPIGFYLTSLVFWSGQKNPLLSVGRAPSSAGVLGVLVEGGVDWGHHAEEEHHVLGRPRRSPLHPPTSQEEN